MIWVVALTIALLIVVAVWVICLGLMEYGRAGELSRVHYVAPAVLTFLAFANVLLRGDSRVLLIISVILFAILWRYIINLRGRFSDCDRFELVIPALSACGALVFLFASIMRGFPGC